MQLSTADALAFFFTPPQEDIARNQAGNPHRSVLAMARQEVMDCLVGAVRGEDTVAARPSEYHRLYASAMVIFASIDLLGKFLAGSAVKGGVKGRFVAFVEQFMGIPTDDAAAVYTVRNAMMHSFGLYDHSTEYGLGFQQGCDRMDMNQSPVWLVADVWHICLHHLYNVFLRAVRAYHAAVMARPELQSHFAAMFPDCGYTIVTVMLYSQWVEDTE